MAFLIKNTNRRTGGVTRQTDNVIDQYIHVACPSRTIPATTTDQIFRVKGGRVKVRQLVGEVTTAIQNQLDNLKVSAKKLDNSSAAVGTAVDIAANVDMANRELGGLYFVEGDGTAGVLSNAGGAFIGPNSGEWIAPQGEIYVTTSATNTGAMKWDIWYLPLDPGAYVEAVSVATVAI